MDSGAAEHFVAVNGDEQQFEEQTEQQFLSEQRGIESYDNVDDSAGNDNDRKRSIDEYDRDSTAGKLFVGGVAWETTEETFTNYFSKYGEIRDSVIMMDKLTGRPRGFGFVTFVDPAVADKVMEEEHVIDGRAVEIKRTVPRGEAQVKGVSKTKKIFVGGIPTSFSEDEFKDYFSSYGNIVEHQIMVDRETGRSRGFGFITFESEDIVENIFSEGKTHELGGKQVEIKKAEPKRGGDFANSRPYRAGGSSKSFGGYGGGAAAYEGGYGRKMGRGYGQDAGYGGYGDYDGYAANYVGGSANFYGGYGGYGYGFGFGGPMYTGGAGYGGNYSAPGYGGAGGYAGGKGYGGGGRGGSSAGYGNSRGIGGGGGGGPGAGYGKGYGGGGGSGGEYSGGKGYGSSGSAPGRYHPYR